MSIPYTCTHIVVPNAGTSIYNHPVQYVKDTHGKSDPTEWEYYAPVYDLDRIVNWWDVEGTDPIDKKSILDWNLIDNVQYSIKPRSIDDNYVRDTRQILRDLLDLPPEFTPYQRLLRPNPMYHYTVVERPPPCIHSIHPQARRFDRNIACQI